MDKQERKKLIESCVLSFDARFELLKASEVLSTDYGISVTSPYDLGNNQNLPVISVYFAWHSPVSDFRLFFLGEESRRMAIGDLREEIHTRILQEVKYIAVLNQLPAELINTLKSNVFL